MATISRASPLFVASQSPRRREMIASLGVAFVARAVDVDESRLAGEAALPYLERIVAAKLEAATRAAPPGAAAILVADTIVTVDGDVLGKPRDDADAAQMITRIAGRAHDVMTRFAVAAGGRVIDATVTTRVHVRPLDEAAVRAYVASGEGRDKAGAYAVQGAFACAVRALEGSYANVVGLPISEVVEALDELGVLELREALAAAPARGA
ncbi:MAG TPA: Maf family nucleotide pyrophosphatase [Polyangiaceae bacterium]|nr:Maf family nucleotide pyrophosphatase [Polyangiaceae bacterium]